MESSASGTGTKGAKCGASTSSSASKIKRERREGDAGLTAEPTPCKRPKSSPDSRKLVACLQKLEVDFNALAQEFQFPLVDSRRV